MSKKVEQALDRLKRILPLKERQVKCSKPVKSLHQEILRSFVTKGRILTRDEMAQHVSNPNKAIAELKKNDMIVCSKKGDPIGAYPFTMEEREHKVYVNGYLVYAMCALDALAISPMFGVDTKICSRCRVTQDPVTIMQSGQKTELQKFMADVHFGIFWGAADSSSCCADGLCMEMIFLRDGKVSRQWLDADPDNRELFTLQEAVEFGAQFFVPLMS